MADDALTHGVEAKAGSGGPPRGMPERRTGVPGGPPAPARAAIQVSGLRKAYAGHVVLDGIDLSVPEGSVLSLLGPNGAGKTTLVRILSTLTSADAGEVLVDGHDVRTEPMAVRSVIGVTGQFSAVDSHLNAGENLLLMADLWHLPRRRGRERAAELLELFDLVSAGAKPVYTFSGGMQRRLDLAMTLMGSPRILVLDEPTTGLDPRGRLGMWDFIRSLVRDEGVTILHTTQYLEEADQLADQVAVLDGGRVVAQGTARALKRRVAGGHLLLTFASPRALESAAARLRGARQNGEDMTLRVPADAGARALFEVLRRIDVDEVTAVSLHTPDLNDVFVALTGHRGGER